jgi:hypothetical protein
MVGLVPTIHVFFVGHRSRCSQKKSWMPGTRPGMTVK